MNENPRRDAPPARLFSGADATPDKAFTIDLYAEKYRISSPRLQYYDYASAGMYFVTINAHEHHLVFGRVEEGKMHHSSLGKIVRECWKEIPNHFPHVEL